MAEEELGNRVFGHPQQQDEDGIRKINILESIWSHELANEMQQLPEFLAEFTIQPLYTKPNHRQGLWCFWSQTESSQANSSLDNPRSDPDSWTIHEKIKSVLTKLSNCGFGLIQFWVPVTRSGRGLLKTFDQPFAVTHLDTDFAKHRICCENYLYDDDIISGPPATAFLNRLPQLINNLGRYSPKKHLYPLLASALEHGLICYIVLPIFDPSTTDFVGVLEHMSEEGYFLSDLLDKSIAAIKEAGLITFDPRECRPCESIDGLQSASEEIKEALETVCDSHNLCLAQAWIRYEESFMERNCNDIDFMPNRQAMALKLFHSGYDGDCYDDTKWFDFCLEGDIHPLIMGEGLVGKALQNHESYLCIDISTVDKNEPSWSHTAGVKGSCFAICLTSTYTQNLDYVLEFLWDNHRPVILLLESILLTLKGSLPSFKVVTGEELGNELCVKEITYPSEANKCVIKDIVISQHKTSPHQEVIEQESRKTIIEGAENLDGIPSFKVVKEITHSSKANECIGEGIVISQPTNEISKKRKHKTSLIPLRREDIEEQIRLQKTMKEAAKNLNVSVSTLKRKCKGFGIDKWPRPKSGKSEVRDSQGGQNGMNGKEIRASQGPSVINQDSISDGTVLTIKAKYGDDLIKFSLPFSTTLQAVEEEISNRFSLKRGTYKLKYRDEENDLVTITCDNDLRDCAKSSRSLNSTTIRLDVVENPATKIA